MQTLSNDAHVYATGSRFSLLWGWDAFRIARHLPHPDVVSVQDPFETGLIGWIIARMRGSALHVQVHTDLFSPVFSDTLINRLRVRIARFVLRRADRIRVVSSRIKESIERTIAISTPITVLPIFTDVSRFKDAHAGSVAGRFSRFETKLLVVARLEKEKNVALAITSFASLPAPNACLIIVGDGSERKALERAASAQNLAGRVFFEGMQDPAPYYACASLLLVPSRFEGYGIVIIEALAAGKPVLATDVGVARDAGALISSPENFKDALAGWVENGPRTGTLVDYPYRSFDEYADAYCADIAAATKRP